jgi:hypothetical protein
MSDFVTRDDGPATERAVAHDIVKRALIVTPFALAVGGAFGGFDGVASVAYGLALVVVNFVLSAQLITRTAKISLGLMGGAVLFGYLMRLGLIFLAVYLVHDARWISLPILGGTIIVTHLGLLVWELKYVAMSLAFPGLKPNARPMINTKPIEPKPIPEAEIN